MDEVSAGLSRVQANTARAFAFLQRKLDNNGIVVNPAKTVALPPDGHIPTVEDIPPLESVHVRTAKEAGVTVVGVPIGTDKHVLERAMEVVKDGGVDRLACCLASLPNMLPRKGLDTRPPLETYKREDDGAQQAYEKIFELPSAAEAQSFFQVRCPDNKPPVQISPASSNTPLYRAGRIGLPSTETRRMSVSIGSGVEILREVLAELTGPLGDRAKSRLPESSIIAQLGGNLLGSRYLGGTG